MSDEPKDLTAEELAHLLALEAKAAPAPWGEEWCYGACRHIDRNCDVEGFAGGEAVEQNGWGRYDGPFVARMRNALPRLLAEVRASRAKIAGLEAALSANEVHMTQTIDERDAHEDRIAKLCGALGLSEEEMAWSNINDPAERCVERAGELFSEVESLRAERDELKARLEKEGA